MPLPQTPEPGHMQDLFASARAHVVYGAEAFRKQLLQAVEFGDLLRTLNDDAAVGVSKERSGIFRKLAVLFPHLSTYTDEAWEDLNDRWLAAVADWLRFADKKTKPNKRWRIINRLRGEPLAAYAALCLQEYAS